MAKSRKGAKKTDGDETTTEMPASPPVDDEAAVKPEEQPESEADDQVEVEEQEVEVEEEEEEENVEAEEGEEAEQFDDAQEHDVEVNVSPIKGFPSPLKRPPPAASLESPPPYAIPTAGSPPGYASFPGGSPPPPMHPYYAGYAAPPGYHAYHHHYNYPYPPSSTSRRPTKSVRKSPPPASTARDASAVYPATPASNSAVNMEAGSGSSGPKKVSPKSMATPNTVASSTASSIGGTPAATPSGKPQRGLRHFSVMVCKHVEERGVTTYNQVADELVSQVVAERTQQGQGKKGKFDEKNIRRRVYDALNVLLAMGIISKDKKDIIWNGLPKSLADTNLEDDNTGDDDEQAPAAPPVASAAVASAPPKPIYTDEAEYDEEEFAAMEREREYLEGEVARKQESLREVLVQQVCFRNLVMRNQLREYPTPGGPHVPPPEDEKIPLPFIICNTKPSAVVQCDMNREKSDVMFEFDSPFEINDDNTILKRMKMDKTSVPALHDMLPEDMFDYCHSAGLLESVLLPGEDPLIPRRQPYYQYDRAYRY